MQYTVDTALEALGLRSKGELAELAECHRQGLYALKKEPLSSRLNKIISLLVEIKELKRENERLQIVINELKK